MLILESRVHHAEVSKKSLQIADDIRLSEVEGKPRFVKLSTIFGITEAAPLVLY